MSKIETNLIPETVNVNQDTKYDNYSMEEDNNWSQTSQNVQQTCDHANDLLKRVNGNNTWVINSGYNTAASFDGRSMKLMKRSVEYQDDDERSDAQMYDDGNESSRIIEKHDNL